MPEKCAFCMEQIEPFHITKKIYRRTVHAICLQNVEAIVKEWE